MAGTAILEREIVKRGEEQDSAVSAAALEHSRRIAENYNFLRFPASDTRTQTRTEERSTAPAKDYAARRIADYTPVQAPAKKNLFEGLVYKDGELVGTLPAPVVAPKQETATVTLPAPADEEDALPTRRTMETLRRGNAVAEKEETQFLSALSAKTKAVLIAIAVAVVLAFVIICVNTSVIGSLDVKIADYRLRAAEQQQNYQTLTEQLADAQDPERIAEWAIENGFVLGE